MPTLLRTFPLLTDRQGQTAGRLESIEAASNELWAALKGLSLEQLKAIQPTAPYKRLIDALIDIRTMMGSDHHPR